MPAPFTRDGLTDRQRRFVQAYRGNATQACRDAGYQGSDTALAVTGHRLLKNERVRAALAARDGVEHDPDAEPQRARRRGRPQAKRSGWAAALQAEVERQLQEPAAATPTAPPVRWVDNARGPAPEWADFEHDPAVAPWGPQPGPQTAFAECEADIAIFGGAAGGGKSHGILYEAAKWTHLAGYRGILFRRTSPELVGGGGLWDESLEWFPRLNGRSRQTPGLEWLFPAGARVELRHLQHEEDAKAHHGRQYAFIGFDELTTFTEKQFWYLVSRLRSTCGVRPYVRATCNPDPDSFVFDLISWWLGEDGYPIPERSGVIRWLVREGDDLRWYDAEEEARAAHPGSEPLSFTFISARLADNPILVAIDPGYRSRLMALDRVSRMRLLGDAERGGNWKARASAGMVLRRQDFKLAIAPPSKIIRTVRAWDRGATAPNPHHPDPDWTRGARISLCQNGELWMDDLVSQRERPALVHAKLGATAASDGKGVIVVFWQEFGGGGVVDRDVALDAVAGYPVEVIRTATNKLLYVKVWAPHVERGMFYLKRASWTEEVLSECDGFPEAAHDDIPDAISLAAQVLLPAGLGFWSQLKDGAKALGQGKTR